MIPKAHITAWSARAPWLLDAQVEQDLVISRAIVELFGVQEINSREHCTEPGVARVPFQTDNPWFTGTADVATYAIDELLCTKLRALYQRKKGRDLFDLWHALDSVLPKLVASLAGDPWKGAEDENARAGVDDA